MERGENPDPGPLPITLLKLSPSNGEVFITHPDLEVGGRETFEAESCRWKRWRLL